MGKFSVRRTMVQVGEVQTSARGSVVLTDSDTGWGDKEESAPLTGEGMKCWCSAEISSMGR